jgi:flagellar basal body-associated protein FliL
MAEEAKNKTEAPATAAPAGDKKEGIAKKAGLLKKTPVLVGGVMILEAAILAAGFKFIGGGPKPASGADLVAEESAAEGNDGGHGAPAKDAHGKPITIDKKKQVELPVMEFRAPNNRSGRTFLYDISIYAVAKNEKAEKVKATLEERSATIKDKVRTIIAQSDPEKLGPASEPGLETLRRQIKYQLEEVVGEGMIDEVIIPRCIPFRTDY